MMPCTSDAAGFNNSRTAWIVGMHAWAAPEGETSDVSCASLALATSTSSDSGHRPVTSNERRTLGGVRASLITLLITLVTTSLMLPDTVEERRTASSTDSLMAFFTLAKGTSSKGWVKADVLGGRKMHCTFLLRRSWTEGGDR